MMATTYEDKLDAKSKEVNFSRTEEIYQLAHRQAIIPPPLNILVFGLSILWGIVEMFIFGITWGKYMINIDLFKPISIDYEMQLVNRQKKRQKLTKNRSPKAAGFNDDFI